MIYHTKEGNYNEAERITEKNELMIVDQKNFRKEIHTKIIKLDVDLNSKKEELMKETKDEFKRIEQERKKN